MFAQCQNCSWKVNPKTAFEMLVAYCKRLKLPAPLTPTSSDVTGCVGLHVIEHKHHVLVSPFEL